MSISGTDLTDSMLTGISGVSVTATCDEDRIPDNVVSADRDRNKAW